MSEQSVYAERQDLIKKISELDFILQSLGGVHEENKEKADEIHKTVSTKKIMFMQNLLNLITTVKVV